MSVGLSDPQQRYEDMADLHGFASSLLKPERSDRSATVWLLVELATTGSVMGRLAATGSMVALSQCMRPSTKCRIVSLTLACIKPCPIHTSPRLPRPSCPMPVPSPTRDAWHRTPFRSGSHRNPRPFRRKHINQTILIGRSRKVKCGLPAAVLRELFDELHDRSQRPALPHLRGTTLSPILLAKLPNWHGGWGVESFCKSLLQMGSEALGCHFDRRHAPSDTTFQRVLVAVDPRSLEQVLEPWNGPHSEPTATPAVDGKRFCGANRLAAEGEHWETVTLVDNRTGLPPAGRSYHEEGGEPAAMEVLIKKVPLVGTTV